VAGNEPAVARHIADGGLSTRGACWKVIQESKRNIGGEHICDKDNTKLAQD